MKTIKLTEVGLRKLIKKINEQTDLSQSRLLDIANAIAEGISEVESEYDGHEPSCMVHISDSHMLRLSYTKEMQKEYVILEVWKDHSKLENKSDLDTLDFANMSDEELISLGKKYVRKYRALVRAGTSYRPHYVGVASWRNRRR